MASTVEIWNLALTRLGSTRVTSITDESKQALSLAAIYDTVRLAEMAAHPWVFAMARAQIPALASAPAYGWSKRYPLPTGCLRLVEVGEFFVLYQHDALLFEIEGNEILCDEASPLRIRYIQDITSAGLFTPLFVDALACRLAAELAEDLTQSLSKRQASEEAYEKAIRKARRANAIQLPPQPVPEDTWLLARRQARG